MIKINKKHLSSRVEKAYSWLLAKGILKEDGSGQPDVEDTFKYIKLSLEGKLEIEDKK